MSTPIQPMTEEEISEVGAAHTRQVLPWIGVTCTRCKEYWPCPVARLIATVEALIK
jgi:hypothetical protein